MDDATLTLGDRTIERLVRERDTLRKALEYIANPVAEMRRQAEASGGILDGRSALALSNDPGFLKQIAVTALESTRERV